MSEGKFRRWKSNPENDIYFSAWYTEVNSRLLMEVYTVTSSLSESEDILHDVVLHIIQHKDMSTFETEKAIFMYIRKAARNKWINFLKKSGKYVSEDSLYNEILDETTPSDLVMLESEFEAFSSVLSEGDKATLKRVMDGKTTDEIAKEEGIKYSNAGVKVHRIRNKIKKMGFFKD